MNSLPQPVLVSQQDALQQYLDSLLQEIPSQENEIPGASEPRVASAIEVSEQPAAQVRTPTWAAVPFQVLLFQMSGLQLAVPLVQLTAVVQGRALQRVPGMDPHLQGLLSYQGKMVNIVETAFVTGRPGSAAMPSDDILPHYLLFAEGRYGFTCTMLQEMVQVEPAAIRCRRHAVKQPWFAGIHTTEMCALLDLSLLATRLSS